MVQRYRQTSRHGIKYPHLSLAVLMWYGPTPIAACAVRPEQQPRPHATLRIAIGWSRHATTLLKTCSLVVGLWRTQIAGISNIGKLYRVCHMSAWTTACIRTLRFIASALVCGPTAARTGLRRSVANRILLMESIRQVRNEGTEKRAAAMGIGPSHEISCIAFPGRSATRSSMYARPG